MPLGVLQYSAVLRKGGDILVLSRYIGDKAFYRRALGVAVPIIIQNFITNFVSMLDNIMVGQIGTMEMSGVSITNQLMMIFNLCIFGITSGAGIFTAQFYGSQDHAGVRHTFRFKYLGCTLITLIGCGIFLGGGPALIRLFLQGEGDPAEAAKTLAFGVEYLNWMLWGLLPFAIANAYCSTLRETGQTVVPMVAGIAAVFVNLVLNYVLIFGHFGAPAMGVRGAALATVISRYAELAIVAVWTHRNSGQHPFICGAFRSLHIPKTLLFGIFRKGLPLLANEFLWSAGLTAMSQCYSTCGLEVVPALNIVTTLKNLAQVASMSLASSVGIIMGQMLGSGQSEKAVRDYNRKLIALAVAVGSVFALLVIGISGVFPMLYNTTDAVRSLSTKLIIIMAVLIPVGAYTLSVYFTLRSGGLAMVTFFFDGMFLWMCPVPIGFILSRFTSITIVPLFAICQCVEVVRCFVGAYMLRKGKWIRNLTQ